MTIAETLDEPLLAELHSYWSERRRGRCAPSRADIDPVDIPHLLPHIALTEIVAPGNGDPVRFRYRLAGTEVEKRFGCALTHRFLDELKEGEYLAYIESLYSRLMAEMAPIYAESSFETGDDSTLFAKRLMLPLSDDQKAANMVLSGIVYRDSVSHHHATVLPFQGQFSRVQDEAE